jgi:Major Facilitator Superfamily.
LSAGYSLTVGTFLYIAGLLGDVFGHKPLVRLVVCPRWGRGYSSPSFFIFCRTVQGIGPAFLLPKAIAIFSRCYDLGLRQNVILNLFSAITSGGFLLGAVFSSSLACFLR